ncbi:MAG: hypothetical protein ACLVAW_15940 [Eisenbergiella massiliensis]
MYYLLLFTPSDTLAEEITALLSLYLGDKLYVENAGPLQGPAAIFPKGSPSAFLLDVRSCPDQDAHSWFRLLSSQHTHIPHWFMMAAQTCGSWYFPSYTTRPFFL